MTVKEFLTKVRRQNSVLLTYERELSELRLRMVNISSPGFGDKVQTNHISSLDEIIEKMEAQADKVNRKWDACKEMKDQAKTLIDKEPDEDRRCVLYRYYIICQSWEQIAVDMHLSIRWITKLHGRALQDLEKEFHKVPISSKENRVE